MARIVGGIATSHIPAIGNAIARGLQNDPYWRPFFEGYEPVHAWLREVRADAAILVYNDHGLNFFLDKMPTFAVGAAAEYRNADEGWGLPVVQPSAGYPELSWHLIESLVADEFDITSCQEMLVDHAFTVPMALLWPDRNARPRVVPVAVNTVQYPFPSPRRCLNLGRAIARAVESFESEERVVIVGTGGLSHQLEGERAGFINPDFDRLCMDKIVREPDVLARLSSAELVRLSGSQGVEFLMWLVLRGALPGVVTEKHRHYHVPVSNTAAAVMVFESQSYEMPVAMQSVLAGKGKG